MILLTDFDPLPTDKVEVDAPSSNLERSTLLPTPSTYAADQTDAFEEDETFYLPKEMLILLFVAIIIIFVAYMLNSPKEQPLPDVDYQVIQLAGSR